MLDRWRKAVKPSEAGRPKEGISSSRDAQSVRLAGGRTVIRLCPCVGEEEKYQAAQTMFSGQSKGV